MSWTLDVEKDGTRFAPVDCTPKELVGMLTYGERGILSLGVAGETFKLTPRFHKSLATLRQVCSNGAVAEAPIFRTNLSIVLSRICSISPANS